MFFQKAQEVSVGLQTHQELSSKNNDESLAKMNKLGEIKFETLEKEIVELLSVSGVLS